MKISSVKIDSARSEKGVWIDNIPEFGDVRLLVRGWNNVAFRRMQQELMRALPRAQRRGVTIDPKIQDQINSKVMRETILFGWENITDDAGTPIPYDKELAGEWLDDPDMRAFFDAVIWASMNVAEAVSEDQDETAKN